MANVTSLSLSLSPQALSRCLFIRRELFPHRRLSYFFSGISFILFLAWLTLLGEVKLRGLRVPVIFTSSRIPDHCIPMLATAPR